MGKENRLIFRENKEMKIRMLADISDENANKASTSKSTFKIFFLVFLVQKY